MIESLQDHSDKWNRPHWGSLLMYVMASMAAGGAYATIIRFPALAYLHHGMPFFTAYKICLTCLCFPMMILEVGIGQVQQTGCVDALSEIHPRLYGAALAYVLVGSIFSTAYAAVVFSWSEIYIWEGAFTAKENLFSNVQQAVHFFESYVMKVDARATVVDGWHFQWHVLVAIFFLYSLAAWGVGTGIATWPRTLFISFLVPCLVVLALLGVVLADPGYHPGLRAFFVMEPSVMYSTQLWSDAFSQALLSLALGRGIMLTYGSFHKPSHNNLKYCTWTVLLQSLLSFAVGLCTFGVLGTIPPDTLLTAPYHDLYIAFIVYPVLCASLPLGGVLLSVFFLLLFFLGVAALTPALHTIQSLLQAKFTHTHPALLLSLICVLCVSISTVFCFPYLGYRLLLSLDMHLVDFCLPFHALSLSIGAGYMWSSHSMAREVRELGHNGVRRLLDYIPVGVQHSIGNLREALRKVGKRNVDGFLFPLLIKMVLPVVCALAITVTIRTACKIYLCGSPQYSTSTYFIGIGISGITVLLTLGGLVFGGNREKFPLPWSDELRWESLVHHKRLLPFSSFEADTSQDLI